jgi:hypothetical protein
LRYYDIGNLAVHGIGNFGFKNWGYWQNLLAVLRYWIPPNAPLTLKQLPKTITRSHVWSLYSVQQGSLSFTTFRFICSKSNWYDGRNSSISCVACEQIQNHVNLDTVPTASDNVWTEPTSSSQGSKSICGHSLIAQSHMNSTHVVNKFFYLFPM